MLEWLCNLFLARDGSEPEIEADWTDEDDWSVLSLLATRDMFAFHAASYVGGNGKGILLPGSAGSGKTTIATPIKQTIPITAPIIPSLIDLTPY